MPNQPGRRRRYRLRAGLFGLASVLVAFSANAEGFQLDPYTAPAPASPFFYPASTTVGPHLHVAAALTSDSAWTPLTLYTVHDLQRQARIHEVVTFESIAHARASLALVDMLRFDLSAPVQLVLSGSGTSEAPTVPTPEQHLFGDMRAGFSARLFGQDSSPIRANAALHVRFPTGSPDAYNGESGLRWEPGIVVAGEQPSWLWSVSSRAMLRKTVRLSTTTLSHEVFVAAAVGLRSRDNTLIVGPEVFGHTVVAGVGAGNETSTGLEAVLGAHKRWGSWTLGFAAGPGLARGIGTPAARVLVDLSYDPPARDAEQIDTDQDGIIDTDDACPRTPGPRSDRAHENGCPRVRDRDGDGVPDVKDACPEVPGQRSCDPKRNGCPERPAGDMDGDGIPDTDDACPKISGEPSCDPKRNGCPIRTDGDHDGIFDPQDACPHVPGVPSQDPRTNGCPRPQDDDRDNDGVPDATDACPTRPGPHRSSPSQDGCPSLVKLTKTKIEILERVYFETARARILPVSDPLLEQVASVLRRHPELTRVRVEGHTDSRGGWMYNLRLSQRRAESVVHWLVDRGGVDRGRLVPRGYGPERPVADNQTPEGRQKNRRVEFRLVGRSQAGGASSTTTVKDHREEKP